MKTHALILAALSTLLIPGLSRADQQNFMTDGSSGYTSQVADFRSQLAERFPASGVELKRVILTVDSPVDAVVCLWLHERFQLPVGKVLQSYQLQKRHGWQAIMSSLGLSIDPSPLKILQNGDLDWNPQIAGIQ